MRWLPAGPGSGGPLGPLCARLQMRAPGFCPCVSHVATWVWPQGSLFSARVMLMHVQFCFTDLVSSLNISTRETQKRGEHPHRARHLPYVTLHLIFLGSPAVVAVFIVVDR